MELRRTTGGILLDILLKPGAKRDRIMGTQGRELAVSVKEQPVKGRANKALIAFMATTLKLPRQSIELVKGARSKHKTLLLRNIEDQDLKSRVKALM